MFPSTSQNNLTSEEQIILAERKYNELFEADAEFEVLKSLRLKIKKLQDELLKSRQKNV